VRLLVSVATPEDAAAAVAGGADIVDAKDPRRGALGAVALPAFLFLHAEVAGRAPVSAAIGDAVDERDVEHEARAFARAGASFVKLGFAGVRTVERVVALLDAALQATPHVIAVAYAEGAAVGAPDPSHVVDAAAHAGALGVLVDTADKAGPGLRALASPAVVAGWVSQARRDGLITALAGKLTSEDVDTMQECGADIIGVRGAACEGGRAGVVSAERVRTLHQRVMRYRPQRCDLPEEL
jgi:uncharacterized protein (UPF0264 family)